MFSETKLREICSISFMKVDFGLIHLIDRVQPHYRFGKRYARELKKEQLKIEKIIKYKRLELNSKIVE